MEAGWQNATKASTNSTAFERTSKRRKGYPSETRVKRGFRVVHGDKELMEKLGRNDLCPCGSGRRLQTLLPQARQLRRGPSGLLLLGTDRPRRANSKNGFALSRLSRRLPTKWTDFPRKLCRQPCILRSITRHPARAPAVAPPYPMRRPSSAGEYPRRRCSLRFATPC